MIKIFLGAFLFTVLLSVTTWFEDKYNPMYRHTWDDYVKMWFALFLLISTLLIPVVLIMTGIGEILK